jgi:uncharacterized protein (DUF1697 family)
MRYVAFLRGINLGKRRVKNDQLAQTFSDLGFSNVVVLIASGNVLFDADDQDEAALTATIEAGLDRALGFSVSTMLRSQLEVQQMLAREPFKDVEVTKQTRRYVTLLAQPTDSSLELPYGSVDGGFRILSRDDREVYSVLQVNADGGRTVDLMAIIEKAYGKSVTTRNWNTIEKAATL